MAAVGAMGVAAGSRATILGGGMWKWKQEVRVFGASRAWRGCFWGRRPQEQWRRLVCLLVTAATWAEALTASGQWYIDPITVKIMHTRRAAHSSSAKAVDLAAQRGECERAQPKGTIDQPEGDAPVGQSAGGERAKEER